MKETLRAGGQERQAAAEGGQERQLQQKLDKISTGKREDRHNMQYKSTRFRFCLSILSIFASISLRVSCWIF